MSKIWDFVSNGWVVTKTCSPHLPLMDIGYLRWIATCVRRDGDS